MITSEKEILIADSGATKTDWCFTKNGKIIHRFSGEGISPVFQTGDEIARKIRTHVYPILKGVRIDAVYFYGAGCIPEKTGLVRDAIHESFPIDNIRVHSDLIAATHSLCGRNTGIACILGTGSNSCQWNGEEIVKQISPLGFILGDEGSGAVLGKNLVSDALKNQLTKGLKEMLLEEYGLTPAIIIEKVYRQPFPNRFLASLCPFLLTHIGDPTIRLIVTRSFSAFFERNVMQYDYQKNKVNFVGSIAWYFSTPLKQVATEKGIEVGTIVQSPMSGLIDYYNH
ncbi:ATPase [Proteiniphilum sp. UBA5384]|uniref:ATPase n=1 Tax=Proteiniphilum sp. UBA5384 TaxID=1947279 RepID=UPI002600EF6B|nr:ATPase [Proteiniphilum sp. UBA5384]